MKAEEIKVGISMDGADEVAEQLDSISTALDDMSPMVSIRGCRDCTFNIHPRRTVFVSKADKEDDTTEEVTEATTEATTEVTTEATTEVTTEAATEATTENKTVIKDDKKKDNTAKTSDGAPLEAASLMLLISGGIAVSLVADKKKRNK